MHDSTAAELFDVLTAAEKRQLARLLRRLQAAADADSGGTSPARAIGLLSAIGAVVFVGRQAREARIGRHAAAAAAVEFFRRWDEARWWRPAAWSRSSRRQKRCGTR